MEKKLPLPLVHSERLWARPWRWAKTVFFLVSMLASLLLVCAPPLLVVLLDLLLPPALLSNFLRAADAAAAAQGPASILGQARAPFHFGSSLVDLPAVSAARSLLILCAYTACGGGGAAYLWVAVACSVGSLLYVLAKAAAVFGGAGLELQGKGQVVAVEAMFLMSLALAAAHLAMAYRASCRERRCLRVYRIDVEAVSHSSPSSSPLSPLPIQFLPGACVGDADVDHHSWERPEDMDTPRTVYSVSASNPGSDVAGETAATLAAAGVVFKAADPAYSRRLVAVARDVMEFAVQHQGKYSDNVGGDVGAYYQSYSGYKDELLWGSAWLLWATKNSSYLSYLASLGANDGVDMFSWDNKLAGARVLLSRRALVDKDGRLDSFTRQAEDFICRILPGSPSSTTQYTPGGLMSHTICSLKTKGTAYESESDALAAALLPPTRRRAN